MIEIDPEKVSFLITKARVINAQTAVVEPDPGSNMADDGMAEILEAYADDATFDEAKTFIDSLSEEEQVKLVALMWIGRGSFSKDDWEEAYETARHAHNEHSALYLLGTPLLGDYLEDGLNQMGYSLDETTLRHL